MGWNRAQHPSVRWKNPACRIATSQVQFPSRRKTKRIQSKLRSSYSPSPLFFSHGRGSHYQAELQIILIPVAIRLWRERAHTGLRWNRQPLGKQVARIFAVRPAVVPLNLFFLGRVLLCPFLAVFSVAASFVVAMHGEEQQTTNPALPLLLAGYAQGIHVQAAQQVDAHSRNAHNKLFVLKKLPRLVQPPQSLSSRAGHQSCSGWACPRKWRKPSSAMRMFQPPANIT